VLLLCSAYPAVRQLVDGNLEAFVIAGALLLVWAVARRSAAGFALGVLLASSKLQASWLLLAFAGVAIYVQWPRREFWKALLFSAAPIAILLAWRGQDWLDALARFPFRGSALDASLLATGLPMALIVVNGLGLLAATGWALARTGLRLGREQAGLLTAAGLLLAPYAASNSVLTPLALAAPALLARRPWLGVLIFLLADLPYLYLGDAAWRTSTESMYWTLFMFVMWAALARELISHSERSKG
jgi:hypothetical protein